jgi:hypothetical protein
MKRLRHETGSADRDVAHAATLVDAARLPPQHDAEAKARVRRAVLARLDAGPGRSFWRPSFAALFFLLAGTAAAASVTWAVVQFVRASSAPKAEGALRKVPDAIEDESGSRPKTRMRPRMPELPALPTALPVLSDAVPPLPATPVLVGPAELPEMEPAPSRPRARKRAAPSQATARRRPSPGTPPAVMAAPAEATPPARSAADTPSESPRPAPSLTRDEPVAVAERRAPLRLARVEAVPEPAPAPAAIAPATPAVELRLPAAPPPAPPKLATANIVTTTNSVVRDDEVALVHSAFAALRREADARKALRLVDRYLRAHPEGKLAEEALALSIEALTALGDPRAVTRAARYLLSYPDGQFRDAAQRARARFAAE